MTRSSLFVTASLACTALLSGGPLLAAGANDPLVPGRHGVRGMKHMAAELGLSQDQIKEIADTPVLMLTGKNEIKDKITAMQVGANDYLPKPFRNEELKRRVERLVHEVVHTI